jgi:predicted RNA binding protein YcfA (HicA-like mRNA interferase family)
MPPFGPVKRADLIRALRKAGFTGPESGGSHQAMRRGSFTLPLPNPHGGDIGKNLLSRILRLAGISREDWERL